MTDFLLIFALGCFSKQSEINEYWNFCLCFLRKCSEGYSFGIVCKVGALLSLVWFAKSLHLETRNLAMISWCKVNCLLSLNSLSILSSLLLSLNMIKTHSSILAWRIPGRAQPSGLPSMGSHRVGQDWSDLAAAAATW